MNATMNDDPMGEAYWSAFETQLKQTEIDRNRRNSMYGGCDPTTWGWRRPTPQELLAEREEATD